MVSTSKRGTWWLYMISVVAALSGLLFGYDTGVISGAILFIKQDFGLTPQEVEWVVSAVLLGALIGTGLGGRLIDRFGRRPILLLTALFFIISSIATARAPSLGWLVGGRVLLGVAIGIASFTAPLYLAEVAPPSIRGLLVSFNQLAITIGIAFSYLVSYYFASSGNWPWMLGLGVIPAITLLSGLLFLPESPRWLVLKGHDQQAYGLLKRLRADTDIQQEWNDIQQTKHQARANISILREKWVRPLILIGLGLGFFQQATGINTLIYYAPTLLQMAHFHQADGAILATLGIGFINVLSTVISLPLLDRWGRRPLLLLGLSSMCISLLALGVAFLPVECIFCSWLAVGSMALYVAAFAISLGPITYLIIAEVFPLQIRGVGTSLAISTSWVFNLLVSSTFLSLIQSLGASTTFWLYSLLCVLGWVFVYFIVPETRGCSLEQIEHNLRLGRISRELGIPVKVP